MAYLPNYAWDLFISYSHDDNHDVGGAPGWVSVFARQLVILIERHLERKISVFFDRKKLKSYNTIEGILSEVGQSALFLLVGSPNWVRPERWCRQEIDKFLEHRPDPSRVFIAEYDPPLGVHRYPKSVPNNKRIQFWDANNNEELPIPLSPGQSGYELAIRTLAKDIVDRLLQLERSRSAGGKSDGRHTVFLAYSTEEVEEEHEQLRNYLVGQGIDVLPSEARPDRPGELEKLLARDLPQAQVFVQLLGRKKARPPEGSEVSPTIVQHVAAEKHARLVRFQWRPDDVDPHKNPDPEYKPLLLSAQNGTPTELAQTIIEKLDEIAAGIERPEGTGELRLVVSADPEDLPAARRLLAECHKKDCDAIADVFDNDDLERSHWADAEAVAFVQEGAPPKTLMARYTVFNRVRMSSGVAGRLKGQALVFFPPPENKAKGLIVGRGLEEIDLTLEATLEPFCSWIDRMGGSKTIG